MDWLISLKNRGVCMGKYLVIAALAVAGLFIFGFGGISRWQGALER